MICLEIQLSLKVSKYLKKGKEIQRLYRNTSTGQMLVVEPQRAWAGKRSSRSKSIGCVRLILWPGCCYWWCQPEWCKVDYIISGEKIPINFVFTRRDIYVVLQSWDPIKKSGVEDDSELPAKISKKLGKQFRNNNHHSCSQQDVQIHKNSQNRERMLTDFYFFKLFFLSKYLRETNLTL
jgi:hypothetical protein